MPFLYIYIEEICECNIFSPHFLGVVEYEFCYRVLETMHNNVKFYYPPTKLLGSFSHDYFYWLPQVCGENDDVWFDALLCLLDIYRRVLFCMKFTHEYRK